MLFQVLQTSRNGSVGHISCFKGTYYGVISDTDLGLLGQRRQRSPTPIYESKNEGGSTGAKPFYKDSGTIRRSLVGPVRRRCILRNTLLHSLAQSYSRLENILQLALARHFGTLKIAIEALKKYYNEELPQLELLSDQPQPSYPYPCNISKKLVLP
ncbi:hypothetical protein APHAL10511_008271 [Amanita phalloides]|nr:hypothetical protein APHAL10511_008271 [Amanita phalloides]